MRNRDSFVPGGTRYIDQMPRVGVVISAELLELELRNFKDSAEAPRWKDSIPYGVSVGSLIVLAHRQYQSDEVIWATGLAVAAAFIGVFFINAIAQAFRNRKRLTVKDVVDKLKKQSSELE